MPRFLAIDADSHGLTVALGSVRSGSVQLEQVVGTAEQTPPLSTTTAAALGAQLAALLKQANIAPAPVLLAVGRDKIVLKEVTHPPSAPQDEPAIVRFQAVKELTESPDEGVLDYLPIGPTNDTSGERRSLVAFVHKTHFAAAKVMCEAAGLKLAALTPRPFANLAAASRTFSLGVLPAPDAADAAVGVLTLNPSSGEFSVLKNGVLRFSRHIAPAALAGEAALVAEMRRNLAIYSSQSGGDSVQAIYLAEGEHGAGWSGRLGAALPVPVHPFDPLVGTAWASQIPANQHSRFSSVVGLLAGKANLGPTPINFVEPRQPKADVNPNRNRTAAVVLLGLVLLGAVGFFGFMLVKKEADKTLAIRQRVQAIESELKSLETDVERVTAIEEIEKRNIPWLDEIYQLAALFPDFNKMKVLTYSADVIPPTVDRKSAQSRGPSVPGSPGGTATKSIIPRSVNAPLTPVAKVRIEILADSSLLADNLVATLSRERPYYVNVSKEGGRLIRDEATNKEKQQFGINAQLVKRAPTDYLAKLRIAKPDIKQDRGQDPKANPDNFDPNPEFPGEFPGNNGGIDR